MLAAVMICGGCATQPSGDAVPVNRAGDANLTCRQIADEAATLSERMGGTPTGGALGGVARAGAAALIPGAGLVMAGVDALKGPERARREADENRWHYLNGLYTARNCLQGGR
ncbi:hypothetical protein GCM10009116_02970 [Brevundimonas basaltis]